MVQKRLLFFPFRPLCHLATTKIQFTKLLVHQRQVALQALLFTVEEAKEDFTRSEGDSHFDLLKKTGAYFEFPASVALLLIHAHVRQA